MIRNRIPAWLFWTLSVLGITLVIIGYGVMSQRMTAKNPQQTIVPNVAGFQAGFERILKPGGSESSPRPAMIWSDLAATYWRLLLGLGLGVVLSIVLGIAMGAYHWIEAPLSPIVAFLSKIPPTAMMPIYFLLAGTDQAMFTAMVGLGVFFSMAQSIYGAVQKDVTDEAIDKAYTLGASNFEILYEVIWKQILPRIIDNIRLQIGPAMIFLLAAEMLVGNAGMGYRIRLEARILNMNVVYIYLIILGLSGLLAERGLLLVRRRISPWYGH